MSRILIIPICLLIAIPISRAALTTNLINGFHFHTYFWQNNSDNTLRAMAFRNETIRQAKTGMLEGCTVSNVNGPIGPHLVGEWETCCNASALSRAASWFMQNRGDRTIYVHPLTKMQLVDHEERAMFLGDRTALDESCFDYLGHVLSDEPYCSPKEHFLQWDL